MPPILQPLFSFGLVADIQYADLPDGHTEARTQRYREAPGKLRAAVHQWQADHALTFVLNLGDAINGNHQNPENNEAELEEVADIFDSLAQTIPVYHVIGNHCLSVDRKHLIHRLHLPGNYYSIELPAGWQLVVLDTTEMSGHSKLPADHAAAREAAKFKEANPLSPENAHMHDWNGGISSKQMRWLRKELEDCAASGKRVMVAAHHQAGRGAARPTHLAWNWRDIQDALTHSKCAHLYLAGHDHMGGYHCEGAVHWVTIEATLEAPTAGNAFAIVRVYNDYVRIEGHGVTSRDLRLDLAK